MRLSGCVPGLVRLALRPKYDRGQDPRGRPPGTHLHVKFFDHTTGSWTFPSGQSLSLAGPSSQRSYLPKPFQAVSTCHRAPGRGCARKSSSQGACKVGQEEGWMARCCVVEMSSRRDWRMNWQNRPAGVKVGSVGGAKKAHRSGSFMRGPQFPMATDPCRTCLGAYSRSFNFRRRRWSRSRDGIAIEVARFGNRGAEANCNADDRRNKNF